VQREGVRYDPDQAKLQNMGGIVNQNYLEFPALAREHVEGARLFADRHDLVSSLDIPPNPVIAEIGVARGDFSEFLIKQFDPGKFVAFDTFEMHKLTEAWGTPTKILFDGMTQLDFFRRRFSSISDRLIVEVGLSSTTLARQADNSFDLIYIDAMHDYQGVKSDAEQSARILKPEGILVFNDYIMFDHMLGVPYGIIPVVNEMVVNQGWAIVGFGLQRHMFCDIAIRRK
jgi:hypothetical protein